MFRSCTCCLFVGRRESHTKLELFFFFFFFSINLCTFSSYPLPSYHHPPFSGFLFILLKGLPYHRNHPVHYLICLMIPSISIFLQHLRICYVPYIPIPSIPMKSKEIEMLFLFRWFALYYNTAWFITKTTFIYLDNHQQNYQLPNAIHTTIFFFIFNLAIFTSISCKCAHAHISTSNVFSTNAEFFDFDAMTDN